MDIKMVWPGVLRTKAVSRDRVIRPILEVSRKCQQWDVQLLRGGCNYRHLTWNAVIGCAAFVVPPHPHAGRERPDRVNPGQTGKSGRSHEAEAQPE